jgi:hypothetical protein
MNKATKQTKLKQQNNKPNQTNKNYLEAFLCCECGYKVEIRRDKQLETRRVAVAVDCVPKQIGLEVNRVKQFRKQKHKTQTQNKISFACTTDDSNMGTS